jgi:hypothetical protein
MRPTTLAYWHTMLFTALGLAQELGCGGEASSNGSGGAGGTAGTGGQGGTEHPLTPDERACRNPTPLLGETTGFIVCDGGWRHRPSVGTCPSSVPRAGTTGVGCAGAGGASSDAGTIDPSCCTSDLDCTAAPHGYCQQPVGCGAALGGTPHCGYGCTTDTECMSGQICVCADPVGYCAPAACTTDADCGAGLLCVGSSYDFHCQTPEDTCLVDANCSAQGSYCFWSDDHRSCSSGVCGRPFLVEGVARLADVVETENWLLPLHMALGNLSHGERSLLAKHYADIARMEHASVAAFARFALELLALGAPAELLEGTHRAMGDEIRHTQLCFGLASAYAGSAVGPGPLPVHDALGAVTLRDVVRTAIREACIGETLAAIEAAEAAEQASVPEVRAIWRGIAEDETRHAELGWRFLRWALAVATPGDRAAILADLVAAIDENASSLPLTGSAAISAHGMLPDAERASARHAALEQVIRPAASALRRTAAPESGSRSRPASVLG